jgi:hypothetical protein
MGRSNPSRTNPPTVVAADSSKLSMGNVGPDDDTALIATPCYWVDSIDRASGPIQGRMLPADQVTSRTCG